MYSKLLAFIRRHLVYSVDADGIMHMERGQNAFTFADNRAGTFVMLASPGTDWDTMMSLYDVRDWIEKTFDVYKNVWTVPVPERAIRTGREDACS